MTKARRRATPRMLVYGAVASGALVIVGAAALRARREAALCPPGTSRLGATCCGEGQRLEAGGCVGAPLRCAAGLEATPAGCVAPPRVAWLRGGAFELAPRDWDDPPLTPRRVEVAPFGLDAREVTEAQWARCVEARRCAARTPAGPREPGRVVFGIDAPAAAAYCEFVGGRLPSDDEWLFAATRAGSQKWPWGGAGLVCRRVAFGRVSGPCASGGDRPDLAGLHPEGASPDGVEDLAGNIAEWTLAAGGPRLRGGSFASTAVSELKPLGEQEPVATRAGVRCAYDAPAPTSLEADQP